MLTRYAGVVDLHIDGVSTTAHQVRVADVDRAMIATTALHPGRQVGQLYAVSGRRTISTGRVRRRDPVKHLDHSDQLRATVWTRRTPQSKGWHSGNPETLTAHVHGR